MRIISDDRTTTFEILRNDPDDPNSTYTLQVDVKDDHDPFHGRNSRISFNEFDLFLNRLEEFIRQREGVVVLEMTEECKLEFFRWDALGNVGMKAWITKPRFDRYGYRMNKSTLEVRFQIDGEFVNQMLYDFRALTST
jgi:hypothetical protein